MPGGQGVLRAGQRRAHSAWYSAKFGAERAGHALMRTLTAAWLWLLHIGDTLMEWGRQCWGAWVALWQWFVGAVAHAVHRVRSIGGRPSPTA